MQSEKAKNVYMRQLAGSGFRPRHARLGGAWIAPCMPKVVKAQSCVLGTGPSVRVIHAAGMHRISRDKASKGGCFLHKGQIRLQICKLEQLFFTHPPPNPDSWTEEPYKVWGNKPGAATDETLTARARAEDRQLPGQSCFPLTSFFFFQLFYCV